MTEKRSAEPLIFVVAGLVVLLVGVGLLTNRRDTNSSAIPPTQPASATQPSVLSPESIVGKPVVIYDKSGKVLGDGTVNLYAPSSMSISDTAKIRLEIVAVGSVAQGFTVGTQGPTAAPSGSQTLSIHQIMGATLQGVDISRFVVNVVPSTGERNVDLKTTTWWEWNIRPVNSGVVGRNSLELFVYYPHEDATGKPFNEEVATFPVNIEVTDPNRVEPNVLQQINAMLGPIASIAGSITAIAGAIGVLYGAYRFVTKRRRSSKSHTHRS